MSDSTAASLRALADRPLAAQAFVRDLARAVEIGDERDALARQFAGVSEASRLIRLRREQQPVRHISGSTLSDG